jgi:hypothetical protein
MGLEKPRDLEGEGSAERYGSRQVAIGQPYVNSNSNSSRGRRGSYALHGVSYESGR